VCKAKKNVTGNSKDARQDYSQKTIVKKLELIMISCVAESFAGYGKTHTFFSYTNSSNRRSQERSVHHLSSYCRDTQSKDNKSKYSA